MQYIKPFQKPWYVMRSIENNPSYNGMNPSNVVDDLEGIAQSAPVANTDKNWLNRAKIVGLSLLAALYIACSSGQAVPANNPGNSNTRSPSVASETEEKSDDSTGSQIQVVPQERTYSFVFPYVPPSGFLEESVCDNTDEVTCQQVIRWKQGVNWAILTASLFGQPLNTSWGDYLKLNQDIIDSSEYIPLNDMRVYFESQPINQTRQTLINPDTAIKYFQRISTGEIIPIDNPDIGEQKYEELDNKFSAQNRLPGEDVFLNQGPILYILHKDFRLDIHLINPDGSGVTNLTNNDESENHPVWSPDKTQIAYWSDKDGPIDIFVMNADGSGEFNLTNNSDDRDFSTEQVWSPDGTRIAFASKRKGNSDIYVINADGSGLERLTNQPGVDRFPTWSPDGKMIAYTSIEIIKSRTEDPDINKVDIYVMNADGTEKTNLTDSLDEDGFPFWSPNGDKIVFSSSRDGNAEIYVMDADGSNQINLSNNPDIDSSPDWSPDGKRIAFESFKGRDIQIYVVDSDGSNLKGLTSSNADNVSPEWSANGTRIVYLTDEDGFFDIVVMNADGSNKKILTNFDGNKKDTLRDNNGNILQPDW